MNEGLTDDRKKTLIALNSKVKGSFHENRNLVTGNIELIKVCAMPLYFDQSSIRL